jgi:hypothetical protein
LRFGARGGVVVTADRAFGSDEHDHAREAIWTTASEHALQKGEAAVGLFVITAWPVLSTATHSDVDGHEIPVSTLMPSMSTGALQVGAAAVGWS